MEEVNVGSNWKRPRRDAARALAASHVTAIRAAGNEVRYPAGTVLVRPGDPADCFVYIEQGEIEVMNVFTGERLVDARTLSE
jgi:CRP-like cAMP-binding protein